MRTSIFKIFVCTVDYMIVIAFGTALGYFIIWVAELMARWSVALGY